MKLNRRRKRKVKNYSPCKGCDREHCSKNEGKCIGCSDPIIYALAIENNGQPDIPAIDYNEVFGIPKETREWIRDIL